MTSSCMIQPIHLEQLHVYTNNKRYQSQQPLNTYKLTDTIQRDYSYYRRWMYEFPIDILAAILIVGLYWFYLQKIVAKNNGQRSCMSTIHGVRFFLDGYKCSVPTSKYYIHNYGLRYNYIYTFWLSLRSNR